MGPGLILILYSGGLDSFIMYHMAIKEYGEDNVKCIFFKHGQDSEQAEIDVLPDFVEVRQLDWLDDNVKARAKASDPFAGNVYIPGRNLVFAVTAASQFLPSEIWMGTVVDEDNPAATDKNETFRIMTQNVLDYVLSPFTGHTYIRFPFVERNMTKENSVAWALENGISKEEITGTTSCWHNHGGFPCGECKQCVKRFLVFALNDIEEMYKIHPLRSKVSLNLMLEYIQARTTPPYNLNADEENMVSMICRHFGFMNSPYECQKRLEKLIEGAE